MPEIEFVGEWDESQASAIAAQFQKAVDSDGFAAAIPQLEDNPVGMLSPRQKKLIELLKRMGEAAFQVNPEDLEKSATEEHECGPDCIHGWGWDWYEPLEKAIKRDAKGRTYRLNENDRWERLTDSGGYDPANAEFQFLTENGEFGQGVYLTVPSSPGGWMRLRLSVDVEPAEMITDEQFYELEADFTNDLALMLTNQGIKAIAKTEGDRVSQLMIRSSSDIEVQGAIAGSGQLPQGNEYSYQLVKVSPQDDRLIVDVEVAPKELPELLSKSAVTERKNCFSRESGLSGSPLVQVGGARLDRQLLRQAIDRCKLDGVDFSGVQVKLTGHRPDFLPEHLSAFCLPEDGIVAIVHHSPEAAIARLTRMLAARLKAAVNFGAIGADEALDILHKASEISPDWWLEMLIKRYVGAVRVSQHECIMSVPRPHAWGPYINLLAYRGLQYWGARRAIAECMAEDFRVAHDPAGLPNLTTMLWDVAVPSIARMCQQSLLNTLAGAGDVLSKSADPVKRILQWNRIEIGVTHDKGDRRHGRKLKLGYGHIRGSYGDAEDGMSLDVYIGPDLGSDKIFKVKQVVPETGELDEHKYFIGCWSSEEVEALYLSAMPKPFMGVIEKVHLSEFSKYQK